MIQGGCSGGFRAPGLFLLSAGAGSATYEFHPQFREFLLSTMEARDRRRLSVLREHAATWLEGSGHVESAVRLYFEANLPKRAAALAERASWPMRRAGRFATLEDWTERCIRSGRSTPWLVFEFASACGERGQFDRALWLLDEHLLAEGAGVPYLVLMRAHILRGLLLYDAGRYAELDKAVQALKRLKRRSVSPSVRAESLRLEACWHASRGDLAAAEATARKAAALRETLGDPHNTAFAQLDLSRYQILRNDPAGVVISITRALQVLDREGAPAPLSAAYNNLAGALHLQGDFDRALDAFARALRAARLRERGASRGDDPARGSGPVL